jgi:hypothetical protein
VPKQHNANDMGNRMGAPPAAEKQAILDEIDQQLADLNVSPDEMKGDHSPVRANDRI